ncbi:MAG: hypothetical protein ACPGWR_13150, partial [Ardenticatenaceae bacterium]
KFNPRRAKKAKNLPPKGGWGPFLRGATFSDKHFFPWHKYLLNNLGSGHNPVPLGQLFALRLYFETQV